MSDHVPLRTRHSSRKRKLMAAIALAVSIFGFVLQTETLGVVGTLGYQKPVFVMYITHCCAILLLPLQIIFLWIHKWKKTRESLLSFSKNHLAELRRTGLAVASLVRPNLSVNQYALQTSVILAIALNLAGASWYIAVNMTTTADLTAIYNCSTFFAYAFSVWILHEQLNPQKVTSVILSIVGVFVIAYLGTSSETDSSIGHAGRRRIAGNIIIALGTIIYGLYEVLYKKIACPPQSVCASKQAAFANLVGCAIGLGTMVLMWPILIILHWTSIETLEIPSREVFHYLVLSIIGNVSFSGAFLILMSLTSPVLGSVSSLLATCTVPAVNYLVWHEKINAAEISGGITIIGAFVVLTWASAEDFIEE